jgi:hypothetical protein
MLRRTVLSAALAALSVPIGLSGLSGLSGTAYAAGSSSGTGTSEPGPALLTAQRQTVDTPSARRVEVSRRAQRVKKARAAATPLTVTIDQLTPSTIPDRGVVRVSGQVTNADDVPWTNINTYSFISAEPLTSSEQLADAVTTEPEVFVGERITEEKHRDTIPELLPGESAQFTFSVPRRLLDVVTPGVYWFGVHALGENPGGRDDLADGRARTFLPLVPPNRMGQQPTAVVIPLRHQLVYADDGSLDDLAEWTRTLSPDGRLRSLVDFGVSSGEQRVTWVVDPALIDAVRRLAEGNPPRSLDPNLQQGQEDGEDEGDPTFVPDAEASGSSSEASESSQPSESPTDVPDAPEDSPNPLDLDELDPVVQAAAQAAQEWLARLGEGMRDEDQVLALPYGDVDVAGAARHGSQLYQRAAVRSGTSLPGFEVTTSPVVASPSGFLSREGLRSVLPDSTVLLSDAMFTDPAPPAATTEGHRVVVTLSEAADGGPGPDDRMAIIAMRQRLLAEAAVRFLRDGRAPLTMVVPHDWNPGPGASFFSGLDTEWLDLTTVRGTDSEAPDDQVDGATLRYPAWQAEAELDAANFDSADGLIRSGAALQNLLTLNNVVSGTVTDQALGTTSYSARSRPIANRASAEASRRWIEERLDLVQVTAPQAVTLSSSSGRFAATISNGLDQPVTVALEPQTDDRLSIAGPARVEVQANRRASVLLTARTEENGIHDVRLLVTDKRGSPLGSSTTLSIRSAQVSNVIWLFLAIGTGLLFGAIAVRLFRRIRNARRTPTEPDLGPEDPQPAEPDQQPAGAGTR